MASRLKPFTSRLLFYTKVFKPEEARKLSSELQQARLNGCIFSNLERDLWKKLVLMIEEAAHETHP